MIMKLLNSKVIIESERFLRLTWAIMHRYVHSLEYASYTDDNLIKSILDPYFIPIINCIDQLFSTNYTLFLDAKRLSLRVPFRYLLGSHSSLQGAQPVHSAPGPADVCLRVASSLSLRLLVALQSYSSHLEVLVYGALEVPLQFAGTDFDEDDDSAVGLEGLEIQLLEFVKTLIVGGAEVMEKTGQRTVLQENMKQFVWLLCTYMQIKKSDAEDFLKEETTEVRAELNDFVALEADDASEVSLRNSCSQFVRELVEASPSCTVLIAEVIDMFMRDEIQLGKTQASPLPPGSPEFQTFYYESANPLRPVFKREAALYLFSWLSPYFKDEIVNSEAILSNTLRNYILPELATTREIYPNLFKYRAFAAGAYIIEELRDTEYFESLSQQLLEEAYKSLSAPSSHLAVLIGSCKALKECEATLHKIAHKEPLERLTAGLLALLPRTSSDTCTYVLQAMCALCKSPAVPLVAPLLGNALEAVLQTFLVHFGEMEVCAETVHFASCVLSQPVQVLELTVPVLCKFVDSITVAKLSEVNDDLIRTIFEILALAVEKVFKDNKGSPVILAALHNTIAGIVKTMLSTDDVSYTLSASNVLRYYLAYAFNTLAPTYSSAHL